MYMVPAILLVVFTFIIVFTASRLHISDTNKVVFMVFAEVIINILKFLNTISFVVMPFLVIVAGLLHNQIV